MKKILMTMWALLCVVGANAQIRRTCTIDGVEREVTIATRDISNMKSRYTRPNPALYIIIKIDDDGDYWLLTRDYMAKNAYKLLTETRDRWIEWDKVAADNGVRSFKKGILQEWIYFLFPLAKDKKRWEDSMDLLNGYLEQARKGDYVFDQEYMPTFVVDEDGNTTCVFRGQVLSVTFRSVDEIDSLRALLSPESIKSYFKDKNTQITPTFTLFKY